MINRFNPISANYRLHVLQKQDNAQNLPEGNANENSSNSGLTCPPEQNRIPAEEVLNFYENQPIPTNINQQNGFDEKEALVAQTLNIPVEEFHNLPENQKRQMVQQYNRENPNNPIPDKLPEPRPQQPQRNIMPQRQINPGPFDYNSRTNPEGQPTRVTVHNNEISQVHVYNGETSEWEIDTNNPLLYYGKRTED